MRKYNILPLILTTALVIGIVYKNNTTEPFGSSQGGAQVQLATSHVPTQEDIEQLFKERERVKKEIVNMTGYW
jgi:hypothetical protein